MDTVHSITRSARSFFFGTAMSRVTGLFRDIAIAMSFGSSSKIAAFMVAYRLANLFRRLLGEGNLQAGFIPHFAELKEEGGHFFRDVAYSMALILVAAVVGLEVILWAIKPFLNADWVEIVNLTAWMVPGLFFICLYGLNSSLLQCRKKYFIPAAAPVVFNLVWIASVLLFPNVTFLAIAISLAFAAQWLVTSFEGFRLLSFKEWLRPHLFSPEFKKLVKPLVLGVIGIGAVQFNSALDPIFARIADLRGPAFLWYAIRIQQLPLALFGIALSGALLPALSRAIDLEQKNKLLKDFLKKGAALMLSASFGIFALGFQGLALIYGHGDFRGEDLDQTTLCLWGYGIGLVPAVFVLILAAKSYAEKNYRRPMFASLIAVGVNIALNALFVFGFGLGAVSVALATSLSAGVNAALLAKGAFDWAFWQFFLKVGFANILAASVVIWLQSIWPIPMHHFWAQAIELISLGTVYLGILAAFLWAVRLDPVKNLV